MAAGSAEEGTAEHPEEGPDTFSARNSLRDQLLIQQAPSRTGALTTRNVDNHSALARALAGTTVPVTVPSGGETRRHRRGQPPSVVSLPRSSGLTGDHSGPPSVSR